MRTEDTATSGWLQVIGSKGLKYQPEKPSLLAGVAVFLMRETDHNLNRVRSDMKGDPHKSSPPFGDDSQPLIPLHWRLLPLSGDPNCVGLSMILQNPTISVNGFSTGA